MAKTEIDSKAAEAANEEQVKETETQAEAEAVKEKEASSEDAQAPEGEKEKKGFFDKMKVHSLLGKEVLLCLCACLPSVGSTASCGGICAPKNNR